MWWMLVFEVWFRWSLSRTKRMITQKTVVQFSMNQCIDSNLMSLVFELWFGRSMSQTKCNISQKPNLVRCLHTNNNLMNFGFWPTVLSVEPLVHCVVCLTVCHLWRYVLWRNGTSYRKTVWRSEQKSRIKKFGHRHISTTSFTATATETAVLPYFCSCSPAIGTRWYKLWSELKLEVVLATIIDPEKCK